MPLHTHTHTIDLTTNQAAAYMTLACTTVHFVQAALTWLPIKQLLVWHWLVLLSTPCKQHWPDYQSSSCLSDTGLYYCPLRASSIDLTTNQAAACMTLACTTVHSVQAALTWLPIKQLLVWHWLVPLATAHISWTWQTTKPLPAWQWSVPLTTLHMQHRPERQPSHYLHDNGLCHWQLCTCNTRH